MSEDEGTYSSLMEIDRGAQPKKPTPAARPPTITTKQPEEPKEDLSTTPYVSQNYRFTEDELRWIRRQAFNLSERFGAKVSQNTVLRVALQLLREACSKSPKSNPLTEAVSRLKK